MPHEAPFELGMGWVDVPFDIPNLRCENGDAAAHTRIGWCRSVYNIPHGFAVQSFVAELAKATERDPKEMLLALIGPPRIVDPRKSPEVTDFWNYGDPFETYPIDTARLRRVVELVAEKADWGRELPLRHGLGIAVHRSFLTYVATVVEAAVDEKGHVTVPRVDTAIDCGFAANPERIRSQIEGAAVMGMALALYGEITFKKGRVEQSNYDNYRVLRIDESPPRAIALISAGSHLEAWFCCANPGSTSLVSAPRRLKSTAAVSSIVLPLSSSDARSGTSPPHSAPRRSLIVMPLSSTITCSTSSRTILAR